MLHPYFYNIAEICAQLDLKNIILSPGSRCAPMTIAFNRHPAITIKTISDERSAAYIALGNSLGTNNVTGLVCTSGTAAANYLPAVTEAFYQQVPLVIFTADRPPEWIDQQDGQAIRQNNLFQNHVKKSFQLPVDLNHPDAQWHFRRTISEAIITASKGNPGPVHVNVPIREPFYPKKDEEIRFEHIDVLKSIELPQISQISSDLKNKLAEADNILVIGGQSIYNSELINTLSELTHKNIVVVGDIISNLHEVKNIIAHPDNFLSDKRKMSSIDLLITFGNSVISKNLKLYLRNNKPKDHWHIRSEGMASDPFQSIKKLIYLEPTAFFKDMVSVIDSKPQDYFDEWKELESTSTNKTKSFLKENAGGEFPFCQQLFNQLPDNCNLHLANSMSVRYANFIGIANRRKITVYSNRGTSGIDGCSSTAVGVALSDTSKLNVLIIGDMAFQYDRNAFWHNYKLDNLKIIVLNNHGGGIFRMIEGPSRLAELDDLFETNQKLSAKNTAEEFGFRYYNMSNTVNSDVLKKFFDHNGAAILEYFSEGLKNKQIFTDFKNILQ